uniref:K Homology domain-containing protein n=1 Tax=Proboscia inermis TaxID=420281 RepID=A0A7S0GD86_9STRA|mmetsp:Transcript_21428/g.21769  ORF Transcript_21428/g.21769 Transcript_21428/m.21769 type:complete len:672 (+) Transcript_21428:73-2088(+)
MQNKEVSYPPSAEHRAADSLAVSEPLQQEQQIQLNELHVSSPSTISNKNTGTIVPSIAKASLTSTSTGSGPVIKSQVIHTAVDPSPTMSSSSHESTDTNVNTVPSTRKKNEGGNKRTNTKKTKSGKNSGVSNQHQHSASLPTMSTRMVSPSHGSMASFPPHMFNTETNLQKKAQGNRRSEHALHNQHHLHGIGRSMAAPPVTDSTGKGAPLHSSPDSHSTVINRRGNSGSNNISAIKILVTNNVAGSIIGKSGKTISDIQHQSQCRIKLSQARDCFPGTNDRVCLLVADNVESVKRGAQLILDKYQSAQSQSVTIIPRGNNISSVIMDDTATTGYVSSPFSEIFMVRILVPSSACGMIIGRGGSNIKAIAEASKSRIQLTQKEEMASVATSERIVTITSPDVSSCTSCVFRILDGMSENPDLSKYANMTTSYSRIVENSYGGKAAAAAALAHANQSPSTYHINVLSPSQQQSHSLPAALATHHNIGHSNTIASFNQHQQQEYFSSPFHQQAAADGVERVNRRPNKGDFFFSSENQLNPEVDGQNKIHDGNISHTQPAHVSNTQGITSTISARVVRHPMGDEPLQSVQVAVPDQLIGGILGRGGAGINDLQMCSGARIKISQRGEVIPGTNNRIITITGTASSCATAQFLISQRMVHQTSKPIDGSEQSHRV